MDFLGKHRSTDDASEGAARRHTLRLGAASYAVLLALAAVFYLERMAVLDMAFQTFQILRTGALQIQSGRFGAAGTQVFAWAAQALGLPLKGVLVSYSMGHVLYYAGIFGVIVLGWRQWQWGLVLVLLATGMTTHTFYWLSEMPQGLAFLVLLLAWLHHKAHLNALRWWEFPVLAATVVTAFYFHPLVLHAMLFCGAYFLLANRDTRRAERDSAMRARPQDAPPTLHGAGNTLYLLVLALFLATAFVKYNLLKLDWYDAQALERAKAFGTLWPHWFDIQSNRDFLRWCLSDYYMVPVLTVLNAGYFFWKKQGLLAALVLGAPLAFVLLVNVPFHNGDNQFYLENLYLPLGLFVAVPFVFAVLPGLLPPHRQWIPVAAVAAVGLVRIGSAHRPWSDRLHWEQEFLKNTAAQHRNLLLTEEQVPMETLVLSWGTAYEFLLLSALQHPDSTRCILVDEASERFDTLLERPRLFLGEFRNYPFDDLPRRYFHPTDTTGYARYR